MRPLPSRFVYAFFRHAATIRRRPGHEQRYSSAAAQVAPEAVDDGGAIPEIPHEIWNILRGQLDPVTPLDTLRLVFEKPKWRRQGGRPGGNGLVQDTLRKGMLKNKESLLHQILLESIGQERDISGIVHVAIRRAIQQQLGHCESPQELTRVTNTALSNRVAAQEFLASIRTIETAFQYLELLRREGGSNESQSSIGESSILHALNIILYRLRGITPAVDSDVFQNFLELALVIAAKMGQPCAMWTYLQECRRRGFEMRPAAFANLCEGLRAWTETNDSDLSNSQVQQEILHVMFGCKTTQNEDAAVIQPYHLEYWLHRRTAEADLLVDWLDAQGSWIRLLVAMGRQDKVQSEWELWLASPLRETSVECHFIRAMESTSPPMAWEMFRQSKLRLVDLPLDLRFDLLMNPPSGTEWTPEMEEESLGMLDREMGKVEAEYGVYWTVDDSGEGIHRKSPDHVLWATEEGLGDTDPDELD